MNDERINQIMNRLYELEGLRHTDLTDEQEKIVCDEMDDLDCELEDLLNSENK